MLEGCNSEWPVRDISLRAGNTFSQPQDDKRRAKREEEPTIGVVVDRLVVDVDRLVVDRPARRRILLLLLLLDIEGRHQSGDQETERGEEQQQDKDLSGGGMSGGGGEG